MLQSGHVRRAVYVLPYFYHIYRSPVLWRPLHSEPNCAHLRACRLRDVMLHARSAMRCMIGRASSMLQGELQAEWLVSGVADFCGYPNQRMDNATLTAGIRFFCLIYYHIVDMYHYIVVNFCCSWRYGTMYWWWHPHDCGQCRSNNFPQSARHYERTRHRTWQ